MTTDLFGEEDKPKKKKRVVDRFVERRKTIKTVKTLVKGPGVTFWKGESLIDEVPICVVTNGFKNPSQNRKTGPMLQAYILRQDVDPWTAIQKGLDVSICGDCILRPQKPGGGGRGCYVQVYPWVTTVWHTYKRGNYTQIAEFADVDPFEGRSVRVGTYGDPGVVPLVIWERMLRNVKGHTMYTSLWKTCDQRIKKYAMASVHNPEERALAKDRGWRTFRTRFQSEQVGKGEIVCPASEEVKEEKRVQCISCCLCNGGKEKDKRKDIAIVAHGKGGEWYTAARSELNSRAQGCLPIVDNR